MPTVDPAAIREKANLISQTLPTFEHALKGLQDISGELSGSPLDGQVGPNGYYADQLSRFSSKLMEILNEFVEDEQGFVTFLHQFSDKLRQTAGSYDQVESGNQAKISTVTHRLSGGA